MMKIAHISDIHLGITMFGRALEEDQRYIMNQITEKLRGIRPDMIVVAGDVFHSTNPPAWGQTVWLETVYAWSEICPVRIIPGNHDSAARLSSNQPFYNIRDIHVYTEPVIETYDNHKILFVPNKSCDSPEEYLRYAMETDGGSVQCDVMVAHHNFIPTDPKAFKHLNPLMFSTSPSAVPEALIPEGVFVLAGHIHVDWDFGNVAYSSSPLQYNFEKTVANPGFGVLTISNDGSFCYERVESEPLHKLVFIDRKTAPEILADDTLDPNSYYRILLSSPEELNDYGDRLREKLPLILSLGVERKDVKVIATAKATARDTHTLSFGEQVDAFCEYVGGDSPEIICRHSDYLKEGH